MMTRSQLEEALSNHPRFSAERLYELCQGKSLANRIMWEYLCELESWKPLEVVSTTKPEWLLVASTSEIGLWHKTSIVYQACDCPFSLSRKAPCCHLSAAMAHEESAWVADAKMLGLEVQYDGEAYKITDTTNCRSMGELSFTIDGWWLLEPDRPTPLQFPGAHEAIEYLAAIASFGWQLA